MALSKHKFENATTPLKHNLICENQRRWHVRNAINDLASASVTIKNEIAEVHKLPKGTFASFRNGECWRKNVWKVWKKWHSMADSAVNRADEEGPRCLTASVFAGCCFISAVSCVVLQQNRGDAHL